MFYRQELKRKRGVKTNVCEAGTGGTDFSTGIHSLCVMCAHLATSNNKNSCSSIASATGEAGGRIAV